MGSQAAEESSFLTSFGETASRMVKSEQPSAECVAPAGLSAGGWSSAERSAAQRLCLLLAYAPASIAMFNRNMEYLAATRRWRDTFRLGEKEIYGRSHYELVPEIPDRWKTEYERCLRGEAIKSGEDYFQRADGTGDWLLREMHPWFDESGEVGGIIVLNEVITERKRAADELEHRRQAQRMEATGQLTGGLAHDLNNLLAVILGNLQLVQRAPEDRDKAARRIAAAIAAAQRGADLTDRLLAFARRQTRKP